MRCFSSFALLLGALPLWAAEKAARSPAGPPDFRPDPRSVQRYGPAYRYPQAGWIVLHVEGEPYARGCQHGRLLAPEIAAHVRCFASTHSHKDPAGAWKLVRTLTNSLFLRRYHPEYLREMKGIADGASAAGARFHGRPLDLLDIVALNAWPEIETLPDALKATPTGLEGVRFPLDAPTPSPRPKPAHCSAFAATGPATRDGKVVFGHITMFDLYPATFYNVWLDVKPAKGHRVLMQSFPGGIHSGLDYYLNDAGLIVCETTIAQTPFNAKGYALASRIRRALQYADSIDKAVEVLASDNNGLYTNEWLLADVKTNEIAMLELGTRKTRLRRSGKDQWYGGTKGFYWGCNNTKDLQVRLETVASVGGRPGSAVFAPSDRDRAWLRLYDKHKGKIDADFGRLAFTTPPIAGFYSVDAKYTTTDLAKQLKTWAIFGPPLGRTWRPTVSERKRFPEVRPLVSNPWAVLHPHAPEPSRLSGPPVVDLHDPKKPDEKEKDSKSEARAKESTDKLPTSPAWHGTILPKADADVWLATAFANYERVVALENALRKRADGGELTAEDRDKLDAALFTFRSLYELGARASREAPLRKTKSDLRSSDWYRVAAGKGVLLLHALRKRVGAEKFAEVMDSFGRSHAGKEVTTDEFVSFFTRQTGKDLARTFWEPWLGGTGLPEKGDRLAGPRGGPFSVLTPYEEVDEALIVYGTADEAPTNREAAKALQQALRRRGANVTVPMKSDRKVTDDDLKGHHLLLVGRPDSNSVVGRLRASLPVAFGPRSFVARAEAFAHPDTAVLAAAENPLNKRYAVVVVAGLSAASTLRAPPHFADRALPRAEVVLLPHGEKRRGFVVPLPTHEK
jgi:hypothetical protein